MHCMAVHPLGFSNLWSTLMSNFQPMSSVCVNNGAPIIMRTFIDNGHEQVGVVLCGWKNGPDNFVVWSCTRDGHCSTGHYFQTWEAAVERFRDRSRALCNNLVDRSGGRMIN